MLEKRNGVYEMAMDNSISNSISRPQSQSRRRLRKRLRVFLLSWTLFVLEDREAAQTDRSLK